MKDTLFFLWCAQSLQICYCSVIFRLSWKYLMCVILDYASSQKTPACHQRCIYFNNSLTTFYVFLSFLKIKPKEHCQ